VRREQYDPRMATVRETFAHYDPLALGLAVGVVLGLGVFLATALLLLKGGEVVGPNLALLANYFVGFRVSWAGAFVGLAEGALAGFALGWIIARLINAAIERYKRILKMKIELAAAMDMAAGDY